MNKSQRKGNPRIVGFIIDGVALLILCGLIVFDCLSRPENDSKIGPDALNITSIIVTLLPAIIAITSISLSLSKEKVYGATLAEIKDFYGVFYFSFLHMTIVMIFSFGFCACFQLLGFRASLVGLNVICLAYSAVFAAQEIPLLSRSKSFVHRLLSKRFLIEKTITHCLEDVQAIYLPR